MSSAEPALSPRGREQLLGVAREAVETFAREGRALAVDAMAFAPELQPTRASFVTLLRDGALRGCTGSLDARRPLVEDVAHNAYRSAHLDPRFEALAPAELSGLEVHVSILSALEPLPADSQETLLQRLRPGVDGLVLREGDALGTFLPAVWESLPAPARFVEELKRKAGLPADHWSPTLRFERYTVEELT